jgi:hypothetical protein
MWWLTYRRSGSIRCRAHRGDLASPSPDAGGAEFAGGHELGAALAALVPSEQVGRMLTIEEARGVLEGLRRRV